MRGPERISLHILDRDHIVWAAERCERPGDHQHALAGSIRVLCRMGELRAPDTDDDLVARPCEFLKNGLVTVVVGLEPAHIKSALHFFSPALATLAAKAPAVNPASMLTTAMTEHDWSMLASAARPSPMYP